MQRRGRCRRIGQARESEEAGGNKVESRKYVNKTFKV